MTIATIGPLAYEFFSGMEGRYETTEAFLQRYRERISELGPAPRVWDKREALEWAREEGYLTVADGHVLVKVPGHAPLS